MSDESIAFNDYMKMLYAKYYELILPDTNKKVIIENKAATYKRLIDTKKGTKFHESIDLHSNLPNYSEVPLDQDLFDLNTLSYDKMFKSFLANIVKYARADDEYELKLEALQALHLNFSPEAQQFYRQVHSCHWFLVPELNSRKFLVNYFTELDLSMCNLSKLDSSIRDFERLKKLNLAGNKLESVEYLPPNLEVLNLSNNLISAVELKEAMVHIKTLDLSFNQLDESAIAGIHFGFTRLLEINLGCNNFNRLDEFCEEFLKFFGSVRSLYVSPNFFMIRKNARFKLINKLPELRFIDGYKVESESSLWEKIQEIDPKAGLTLDLPPTHKKLKYAFKFDPKTPKIMDHLNELKAEEVINQPNATDAPEKATEFSLKVKLGNLYELPTSYFFKPENDETVAYTYRIEILVGSKSYSITKGVESIDNPDKNNPEKNNCLKLNFEQIVQLDDDRSCIETLLQGVFVKIFECKADGEEKFVAFARLDTYKFLDPLKDLFSFNTKRLSEEKGASKEDQEAILKEKESVGIRGGNDNEFYVQLVDANKVKYKQYLVQNPVRTDYNLTYNTKEFNFDKRVGKVLFQSSLSDVSAPGLLNIEASLVKNWVEVKEEGKKK